MKNYWVCVELVGYDADSREEFLEMNEGVTFHGMYDDRVAYYAVPAHTRDGAENKVVDHLSTLNVGVDVISVEEVE